MRTRPLILAATAIVALVTVAGPVAAHGPDPILGGGVYNDHEALDFDWQAGAAPPASVKTAILDAADDANDSRRSRAPLFGFDGDATSPIRYGGAVVCGENGIACMRRDPASDWFRMDFRADGHVFDWGRLRWCQVSGTVNGCYDVENVALDEFGHVAILDHHDNFADDSDYLDAVVQTYSRVRPRAGWPAHVYGVCDVARLQLEYDTLDTSSPISTCLDLRTTLSLTASPTSVAYDGRTTLTAQLKVADDATYDRLRLNWLSDRTLVLQRRPPGGTWADSLTIPPAASAGTYIVSVGLKATTEFRVVFRDPPAEGLRAATSPTVKVTVGGCTTQCPQSVPGV